MAAVAYLFLAKWVCFLRNSRKLKNARQNAACWNSKRPLELITCFHVFRLIADFPLINSLSFHILSLLPLRVGRCGLESRYAAYRTTGLGLTRRISWSIHILPTERL